MEWDTRVLWNERIGRWWWWWWWWNAWRERTATELTGTAAAEDDARAAMHRAIAAASRFAICTTPSTCRPSAPEITERHAAPPRRQPGSRTPSLTRARWGGRE